MRINGILAFCTILMASACSPGENLLRNGGFEQANGAMPAGWTAETWQPNAPGVTCAIDAVGAAEGRFCVRIENSQKEDTKLFQRVAVKPNSTYKLSARIKARAVGPDKAGASVTVMGILDASADFKETGGEWKYAEIYGRTGPHQRELSVCARLGHYGNVNTGVAWFDDMKLEKVFLTPLGKRVVDFFTAPQAAPRPAASASPSTLPWIFLFAAVYLMVVTGVWFRAFRKASWDAAPRRSVWAWYICALAASIAVRMLVGRWIEGLPCDIVCFKAWAISAAEKGLPEFYRTGMFVDYPPGYVYVLYVIGIIRSLLNLQYASLDFLLLIKLPSIIADAVCALLILRLARTKMSLARAAALSGLYAWNPASIYLTAAWGQVDAFLALPVLIALVCTARKRMVVAAIFLTIAALIKPQALLFAPLGVCALIRGRNIRTAALAAGAAIAVFVVGILPFSLHQEPMWIVNLYAKTLGSYPYATMSAPNVYALMGANWANTSGYFLCFSYGMWGTLSLVAIVLAVLYASLKGKSGDDVWYALAFFTITAAYMLSVKMHERYLFPALLLAAAAFARSKDPRMLVVYAGFTVTLFIDIAMVLDFQARMNSYQVPALDPVLIGLSIANLALFIFAIKVVFDACFGSTPKGGAGGTPSHPGKVKNPTERIPRSSAPL